MNRMRWISGLAPALLVVAIGCGGKAGASAGGTSDTVAVTTQDEGVEDESTQDLAEHHRHHSHGGFAMFIAMSIDGLGTTPEQQAQITKIKTDLHAKMAPARDAEKAVLALLADQVAAGAIDPAALKPAVEALGTASAGVHDAVADSLNELHALLTPPQRAALVDKVEAHLAVWHKANTADEPAEKDAHGGHLGKLAKEYNLTPAQVETVRASFHTSITSAPKYDRGEAEAHMKAFGEAFEGDTFDAKAMKTGGAVNSHMATWGVHRMIHLYKALVPVLTPEQRTKVADQLRAHSNYKPNETASEAGAGA